VIEKIKTTWSSGRSKTLEDRNNQIFFIENKYFFNSEEPEHLEFIKSYIYNSLVAQGIESFESYLKNLVRIIIKENLGEKTLVNLKNALRTNKERLKFIKDYLEPLDNWTNSAFEVYTPIFEVLEEARHIIVHSDQIIKAKENGTDIRKKPFFERYFKTLEKDRVVRISIEYQDANFSMEDLSQFSYVLFDSLSLKHGVPISIS